jgi:LysM repeat protein
VLNALQNLIDRIPSGLRRIIIAVIVLALLAVFFPLQQDVNRLNQPLPPLTPTPAPVNNTNVGDNTNSGGTSGGNTGGQIGDSNTPTPRPSATPRATATPSATRLPCGPEEGWVIYTVRPGDTLNAIALLVGSTVEELVECNDLANPNALRVNQQVFVPSLPSAFVTSTATPSITPTATATPRS